MFHKIRQTVHPSIASDNNSDFENELFNDSQQSPRQTEHHTIKTNHHAQTNENNNNNSTKAQSITPISHTAHDTSLVQTRSTVDEKEEKSKSSSDEDGETAGSDNVSPLQQQDQSSSRGEEEAEEEEEREKMNEEDMEVARQVFQVFDSDGDGVLSATEIQQVLHRLGVCVSDQDISLLMNELSGHHGDGNGGSRDAVVTLSSFVELMQTPIPMLQQRYCTCQRHSREQQHQLSMRRKSYPDERYHTSSGTRKPRVDMRRNSVFASRNVRPHHHHRQHNQLTMDDDDDMYNYLNDHYNHNFNNYHYDSGKRDKKSEKFSLLRTLKKLLPKLTCMHSDDAVAEPCCAMFHDYPLIVADTAQLFPHINPRQMERIQELFTVFKVFDCNGDGQISIHEVQNIVEKLGLQQILSYHELDELFKSVDSNSDGCITFCEFRKLLDF